MKTNRNTRISGFIPSNVLIALIAVAVVALVLLAVFLFPVISEQKTIDKEKSRFVGYFTKSLINKENPVFIPGTEGNGFWYYFTEPKGSNILSAVTAFEMGLAHPNKLSVNTILQAGLRDPSVDRIYYELRVISTTFELNEGYFVRFVRPFTNTYPSIESIGK